MTELPTPFAPLQILIGREISAVCFVRDYVELHFDGPVLRALANPYGMYGCQNWRFPEGHSTQLMLHYIAKTIDHCAAEPGRYLAVDSGEHRFAIPLDHHSRPGPEAAHLINPDTTSPPNLWIW
ncbi:hypothetical protein EDD99_0004 [Streptomyces sp. 846.5]|nr:hypothetical protein [Streptomyces sp. 846.5]TDU01646.1 hypothetical protein EDD99_0004 [Streptomyces sp. 846.5]